MGLPVVPCAAVAPWKWSRRRDGPALEPGDVARLAANLATLLRDPRSGPDGRAGRRRSPNGSPSSGWPRMSARGLCVDSVR